MKLLGKLFFILMLNFIVNQYNVAIHCKKPIQHSKLSTIKRPYASSRPPIAKRFVAHYKPIPQKIAINEFELVKIHLLDSCTKITKIYGAPTEIESADTPTPEGLTIENSPPSNSSESVKVEKEIQFVRWNYIRGQSKYSFLINIKSGRVVQIETIGLLDFNVQTKRKITLGSPFSDIVNRYGNPEKYEFDEKNVLVSYVSKYNVLFRLSKTEDQKPYKVVGIVVTTGKI